MRLIDVMTSDLPTLAPEDSVREAARRMAERLVAALPVCRDEQLVGIVTDWDVTLAAATKEDMNRVPVAEVMTHDVASASPDASLHDAAAIMGDCRCHHLCVAENGRFRGMVHLEVDWMHLGTEAHAPLATFSPAL
jgi:CBS domain-containing protein